MSFLFWWFYWWWFDAFCFVCLYLWLLFAVCLVVGLVVCVPYGVRLVLMGVFVGLLFAGGFGWMFCVLCYGFDYVGLV